MKTVAIVDYGMGNLRSVTQAVMHAAQGEGVETVWARTPEEVMAAERVVLPGQGGMRDCMRELHDSGMLPAVLHAAANKPLMGVCVGMQMLLDHSEELDTPCLGLVAGKVVKFELEGQIQPDGSRYKVPQMGWNQVWQSAPGGTKHPVWGDVPDGSHFTLSTVITPVRWKFATLQAKRTTVPALPRPLRAIIFSQPNSTLKKAPNKV